MEQKIIISDSQYDVQNLIDKGWRVVSVIAQHVSTSSSIPLKGMFCFILENFARLDISETKDCCALVSAASKKVFIVNPSSFSNFVFL